ncbi:MAG: hypothetical protein V1910_02580 [bacterium]
MGTSILIKDIFVNSKQEQLSLDNVDRARLITFTFTSELRSASTGADGSYPITQANSNQIIFYSSYGDSMGLVNKIRYFISENKLKKGVIVPAGNLYNQNSETISVIGTEIKNENVPLFYYYDGNYNGNSLPLDQPVNINLIKYVKINMVILKQSSKNSTSTFVINAGSSIRNLKTNWGE